MTGALSVSLLAACGPAAAPPAPTSAAAPTSAPKPAAATAPTVAAAAPAAATTVPAKPATGQPRPGGTLRVSFVGDITNVDGHYYSPKFGLGPFIIFDTLTAYDDNLKPQPRLAESWEQSSDARQITLNLRKGVMFHTGRELTADDVVYNMNRVLDRKLTAGILTGFIPADTTFEARDKSTVVVKAKEPWPAVFDWLQVLNIIDKETAEGPDSKSKAVGTGPFSLVEWQPGASLRYAKNKSYWQSGLPYLDEIVVTIARDDASMTAQLEAGALDLVAGPSLTEFNRLKATYQSLLMPNAGTFHQFQPNVTFAPLDNKVVRQALNYAIDRKRIAETVLQGVTQARSLPWPSTSPAYEAAKVGAYAFDLDKAKSLLASAGVSGLELDYAYANTLPEYAQMGQIYQSDLGKIGVKLSLKALELSTLFDQIHNQTYHGLYTLGDSWAGMEPISLFTSGASANVGGNNAGFKEPRYAELVHQAATEPDAAKRKAVYSAINDYMLDQAFQMPVAGNIDRILARAAVRNIGHRANSVWSLTETWIDT
jgi:peptide/nickel transport system substrate-binding protein